MSSVRMLAALVLGGTPFLAGGAGAAPPSCVQIEPRGGAAYDIINNCGGNGYALVRTTGNTRRRECDVYRISTNRIMAPKVYSYFGQRPEIVDACGDTSSCRRELQGRAGAC